MGPAKMRSVGQLGRASVRRLGVKRIGLVGAFLWFGACGGPTGKAPSSCSPGEEACECDVSETCDPGLECRSTICVAEGAPGTGGRPPAQGGSSSTGGSSTQPAAGDGGDGGAGGTATVDPAGSGGELGIGGEPDDTPSAGQGGAPAAEGGSGGEIGIGGQAIAGESAGGAPLGGATATGGAPDAGGATGDAGAPGGSAGEAGAGECPATGGPVMRRLPAGYCIDTTEVTRADYESWLADSPSTEGQGEGCATNDSFTPTPECLAGEQACQGSACGDHPQICVDWCDAVAYCAAVGKRLCGAIGGGATPWDALDDPDVSQWYDACSSHGVNDFPYGVLADHDGVRCNGGDNEVASTVPVASLSGCQSSLEGYEGVFDQVGNLWEWEDSCDGASSTALCRMRGGSFTDYDYNVTCAGHLTDALGRFAAGTNLGFRCCAD